MVFVFVFSPVHNQLPGALWCVKWGLFTSWQSHYLQAISLQIISCCAECQKAYQLQFFETSKAINDRKQLLTSWMSRTNNRIRQRGWHRYRDGCRLMGLKPLEFAKGRNISMEHWLLSSTSITHFTAYIKISILQTLSLNVLHYIWILIRNNKRLKMTTSRWNLIQVMSITEKSADCATTCSCVFSVSFACSPFAAPSFVSCFFPAEIPGPPSSARGAFPGIALLLATLGLSEEIS